MPQDVAFKAIDFLFDNAKNLKGQDRMVEISFWGGEPLLKWSLLQDIARYAQEKSAQLAVPVTFGGTTNGLLLTPEKFDFLDEIHCKFLVSFDGTPETHNYYRKTKQGFGSHKIVAKNLEKVLKRWSDYRPRMGPFAERIDHFFEDVKYLFDFGFNYILFSPVYESGWTEEKWKIFEEQCVMVIDYMAELRAKGRPVVIEHFKSYTGRDNSQWPCGAGRFYVGIDIDGAIYPCHRFNKFNDNRPWQEKEVCIGHINCGITRPEFRDKFIHFNPQCNSCERLNDTPCIVGDTKISLLNGTEVPIQELIDKEPFWVYSSTEDGQIVPGLAHSVRKTGIKEVIEITLDNGMSFQCTHDHLLMLRDGTYQMAKDCQVGQSLMPLYRGINKKGYEWVVQNDDESLDLTYRLVSRYFNGHNEGSLHIHHVNFNRRDNTPDNLIRLTKEEHEILHVESVRRRNKEGASGWKAAYKNPEYKKAQSERLAQKNKERWADPDYRSKMIVVLAKASKKAQELWKNDEFRQVQSTKNSKAGKIGGGKGKGKIPWNKGLKNAQILNHTIVSIVPVGLKEVYDLTVEKFHNFAITAGIFIHNCHGGCYAVNYDFNKDITKPYSGICRYVQMQKKVSEYYKEEIGMDEQNTNSGKSCICHNMCYAENTPEQVITVDNTTDATCICNQASYVGPKDPNIARPLTIEEKQKGLMTTTDRAILRNIIMDIDKRLKRLEEKVGISG
jgi:radical SAM protein with 4Fe4S-binding SPASM domain